ncbi:MAG: methyltransferase domain-containing protein [Flavobacteriales bacterium]|nr:methyltransferase domain-containing protein [Flavobacteriales bacterium]
MSGLKFFTSALKTFRTTGSLVPSSQALIGKMISPDEFQTAKTIVELGPGNGCITEKALLKISPDAHLTAFEVNDEFVEILNQFHSNNFSVLAEGAENIGKHFAKESVDIVISSLPLANFNKEMKTAIISAVKEVMKPDALYIQYQYSLLDAKFIKASFSRVKRVHVMRNVPPAFVYFCRK